MEPTDRPVVLKAETVSKAMAARSAAGAPVRYWRSSAPTATTDTPTSVTVTAACTVCESFEKVTLLKNVGLR